ncbi:MAG TPA: phosphatidylglycerophosphatase A [Gammaproteobacteria bacterium]|nr:phosphatidylglycerophosphatase A [Gammaproteobacteria bacterium]
MSARNWAPNTVWNNPIHFLAFGFGSGAVPFAPGTAGTLVGVIFCVILSPLTTSLYLLVTSVLFLVGIVICHITSQDLGVHDHSGIVWDEIVGYLLTLSVVPVTPTNLIVGFFLFRLFDILKPWPISWLDRRISGGFGIMLDDILAGLVAMAVLYGIHLI